MTKVTATWLTNKLKSWQQDRKESKADERSWQTVTASIIKQTKSICARYEIVTTVAFPNKNVGLWDIYEPSTISALNGNESYKVESFPEDLFDNHNKILVVDVAGMGKSTTSRVIFLKAIEERKILPILIDLRRLSGSEPLETSIATQFSIGVKNHGALQELLFSNNILYILDGFDEVADNCKTSVSRQIRSFVDRCEKGKFIITSRPEIIFGEYTDFTKMHLDDLTPAQAHSLINRYGRAYNIEDSAAALLEELRARHDAPVSSFLENPLLTSLLFRSFEFKSIVPVKRSVFYSQVFDAIFEAHDLNKETGFVREKKTHLHYDEFLRALRALASLFRQRKVTEVKVRDFLEMSSQITNNTCPDLNFAPDDFLDDVTHAVPLFTREGDFVRWSHKSLLDYFLSEFLLRDFAKSKVEALAGMAFGKDALSNENFLVLVYESDPILFNEAVTLPSIEQIKERRDLLRGQLPKAVSGEKRSHMVDVLSAYEFFFIKDCRKREGRDIFRLFDEEAEVSDLSSVDLHPRIAYEFSSGLGLVVLSHKCMTGLSVPLSLGVTKKRSLFSIAASYDKRSTPIEEFDFETSSLCRSNVRDRDWSSAEEQFQFCMSHLRTAGMAMPDFNDLDVVERELRRVVNAARVARSEDVFS